jgi:hypothetical protein
MAAMKRYPYNKANDLKAVEHRCGNCSLFEIIGHDGRIGNCTWPEIRPFWSEREFRPTVNTNDGTECRTFQLNYRGSFAATRLRLKTYGPIKKD